MTIRTAFLAALLCLPALAQGQDTAFRAGFAQMNITPVVPDTWTDADGNSRAAAKTFSSTATTLQDSIGMKGSVMEKT